MGVQALAVAGERWTPARAFLALVSLWLTPLGLIGLAIDRTFPLDPAEAAVGYSAHILGVFETNGWHSLAGLLLGVLSLYFVLRPKRAREVSLAIGIAHVGIVVALIVWEPATFLIASNMADQIVHGATALGGIAGGLLTPRMRDAASA